MSAKINTSKRLNNIVKLSRLILTTKFLLEESTYSPLGKLVKGFLSYDRTYKQTNGDYYFIYI